MIYNKRIISILQDAKPASELWIQRTYEYSYEYLEVADDIKINAIYTMAEDEIKEIIVEYTPEFKAEFRQQG